MHRAVSHAENANVDNPDGKNAHSLAFLIFSAFSGKKNVAKYPPAAVQIKAYLLFVHVAIFVHDLYGLDKSDSHPFFSPPNEKAPFLLYRMKMPVFCT